MTHRRLSLPFDGARAREERERRGLTLKDLSDRTKQVGLRITPASLCRYENGAFGPSAPRLKILAAALDIEIDDLLKAGEESGTQECAR